MPLITANRTLGTLSLSSLRPGAFTQEDVDLLMRVANQVAIAIENALAYREIAELKNKLADEKLYLEEEIRTEYTFEEIVGESPALKRVLSQVETVAPTDSSVLVLGETGTGKEVIARAIHDLSPRRERTFVKVNCAAIPTGLLESELFGHEKGAFTGAIAQKVGRFELAHRGTLFLDEVGDIPLELQPKLLRVLQEKEFERLGSTRTLHVDVRVVAATNRDLTQMVEDRLFRSDLYYRLNVFPIIVPPLRERAEDIPLLVRYFAQKHARRMDRHIETIPAEEMEALTRYHWPGNVRELENLIERAVILSRGPALHVPLPEDRLSGEAPAASPVTLEAAEREHILRALRDTNWVIAGPSGAAARLGMKRTTLQSRMAKLGISRPGRQTQSASRDNGPFRCRLRPLATAYPRDVSGSIFLLRPREHGAGISRYSLLGMLRKILERTNRTAGVLNLPSWRQSCLLTILIVAGMRCAMRGPRTCSPHSRPATAIPVRFTDVREAAGITFQHDATMTRGKELPRNHG